MEEMRSSFDISYKDLEKAKKFNENLNTQLEKSNSTIDSLNKEIKDLGRKIKEKDNLYQNLVLEIDIREKEKEKIIDHIKKQAENAVVFYKTKYERKLRESNY